MTNTDNTDVEFSILVVFNDEFGACEERPFDKEEFLEWFARNFPDAGELSLVETVKYVNVHSQYYTVTYSAI